MIRRRGADAMKSLGLLQHFSVYTGLEFQLCNGRFCAAYGEGYGPVRSRYCDIFQA